ncbi:acyltransferase family protein [Microbacterium sp.]|uniref:acyltransferase family protein n=1 Tax=Microbacterium sp. TaxID=51671 RepID=UPI0039E5E6B6
MPKHGEPETLAVTSRIRALDGLRGLAALVVLLHHALLVVPSFAEPYMTGYTDASPWMRAMTYTPLHVVWAGQSAVLVFFVLSGLVLTLPVIGRGRRFSWASYYPQRLVRLYLPAWGAVAVAIIWVLLVPRDEEMTSLWVQARSVVIDDYRIPRDILLIGEKGGFVSPLWSLKWEIWFSILLPILVFLAVKLARWAWLTMSIALIAVGFGSFYGLDALNYLPMFFLGAQLAVVLPAVRKRFSVHENPLSADEPRKRRDRYARWGAALLIPSLLVLPWILRPFGIDPRLLLPAVALGALLAVIAAIVDTPFAAMLRLPALQWMGLISFSLYLTHEPLVLSMAFIFGEDNATWAAVTAIALSFPLAYLFYRFVEAPSHRLARAVRIPFSERHEDRG